MIFVDTSAWFASAVPSEIDHSAARAWLAGNTDPLLTTGFVVDETLTLLRARGQGHLAQALGQQFFLRDLTTIYFLSEDDVRAAWDVFQRYSDKGWSFTDCTSKVVIERLGLPSVFAFDHHFHQFGTVRVLP